MVADCVVEAGEDGDFAAAGVCFGVGVVDHAFALFAPGGALDVDCHGCAVVGDVAAS